MWSSAMNAMPRIARRDDDIPMTNDCFYRQCRFCKDLDHCNCECHDQERAERAAIEGEDE